MCCRGRWRSPIDELKFFPCTAYETILCCMCECNSFEARPTKISRNWDLFIISIIHWHFQTLRPNIFAILWRQIIITFSWPWFQILLHFYCIKYYNILLLHLIIEKSYSVHGITSAVHINLRLQYFMHFCQLFICPNLYRPCHHLDHNAQFTFLQDMTSVFNVLLKSLTLHMILSRIFCLNSLGNEVSM